MNLEPTKQTPPIEGTRKRQVWNLLDYLERAQQQKIDRDGFVTTKINFSWFKDAVSEYEEHRDE